MDIRGLIFDFDGVIADSEGLANLVLAEIVTSYGRPASLNDALDWYMGKTWPDVIAAIERHIGRAVPGTFSNDLRSTIAARFRSDLREVEGAGAFVEKFSHVPRCIASASSRQRLQLCLDVLGLTKTFAGHVFSVDMVARSKPHPDIFLFAAERLKIAPENCVVIEDSVNGVRAGVAAGMTVVGLCAGSHVRAGHAQTLIDAGAHYTAQTWSDVEALVGPWIAV
jgi:beta-phosphoglucomutase-like phosphatase (HAD superfamily)